MPLVLSVRISFHGIASSIGYEIIDLAGRSVTGSLTVNLVNDQPVPVVEQAWTGRYKKEPWSGSANSSISSRGESYTNR